MQKNPNNALGKKTFVIHVIVQGLISTASLFIGFTRFSREIMCNLTASILNLLDIEAEHSAFLQVIGVKISDGNILNFSIQEAFSGFLTMPMFVIIYLSTVGILQEKLIRKILWLFAGIIVAMIWNINRFVLSISLASTFGLHLFSLINYLLGPITDILFILSFWSLALSRISQERRV